MDLFFYFRQFNILSSSVVSTPLPNISPNQAQQSSSLIRKGNTLLQTLFRNGNFPKKNRLLTNHPLAAIGLQTVTDPINRESLILQAKEQESIEEQRQIDLLLNQKSEKEKLVIEALIQQGLIQGPKSPDSPVPTFIPTPLPSPVPITTSKHTTPDTILPDFNLIEKDKSSGDYFDCSGDDVIDCSDSDDEDEFEVEIILDMTRELVEAKRKEKIELDKAEDDNFGVPESLEAIIRARQG